MHYKHLCWHFWQTARPIGVDKSEDGAADNRPRVICVYRKEKWLPFIVMNCCHPKLIQFQIIIIIASRKLVIIILRQVQHWQRRRQYVIKNLIYQVSHSCWLTVDTMIQINFIFLCIIVRRVICLKINFMKSI